MLDPRLSPGEAACVSSTSSSYLAACCPLLLGIDVDGCLIDACESVVSGIVSGGSSIQINVIFKIQKEAEAMKAAAAKYSHRAVWPLLVTDKVVGGQHHLADITVKAGFMPVLREGKKII